MLLLEAAGRAGVATQPGLLGRPTCMALPAALASGTIASTACIGNRVYTDLGDDELYVTIPGRDLPVSSAELATIVTANNTLADYHRARRTSLATGIAAAVLGLRSSAGFARRNRMVQGGGFGGGRRGPLRLSLGAKPPSVKPFVPVRRRGRWA
jgi:hypothetical protein